MSTPSEKLLIAAANGDLNGVTQAVQNGANINSKDLNNYTALHCAVYNNKVQVVKYLVQRGANVLEKDTHAYVGFTPLHYASAFGSSDMVRAILLTTEKNIHVKNSTGQTPADVASNSEVKEILVNDEKTRKIVQQQNNNYHQQQQQKQPQYVQQGIQQQQQQSEPEPEQSCSTTTSQCCKGKKKCCKIALAIATIVFLAGPAFHLFFTPYAFPYYIYSCGLIVYIGGLLGIQKKTSKCASLGKRKGLAVHAWTVIMLNLICMPTFGIPIYYFILILSATPLIIHGSVIKAEKAKAAGRNFNLGLAIHGILYAAFALFIFVAYCVSNPYYKNLFDMVFWAIPVTVWTVIFGVHVIKVNKDKQQPSEQTDNNNNNNNNGDIENQPVQNETVPLRENNVVEQVKAQNNSTIYPQVL